MQPVLTRSSVLEDPDRSDPPDVFCSLGSLIVEGRVPAHHDRGYGEGPHVPPSRNVPLVRHECSEDSFMCKRDESFRKHLLLLWQNSVPISIEVLLCSDCRSADRKSSSIEFSSVPEPGAILLEQWTVSIHSRTASEQPITSRGLFQAVRSYLHFSQLSAWYSSTKGREPKNVIYRITIPGENFSTKFSQAPVEHRFPPATVGNSACYVAVRSLPRSAEIPRVECLRLHNCNGVVGVGGDHPDEGHHDAEDRKLPMAGALAWKDPDHSGSVTDLRKAIVKSRLAECAAAIVANLDRSDSMDSILSESLLDPPQSLQKIPPKRYQSPSRCGSPSLEAPDHLLFGTLNHLRKRDESLAETSGTARRARQDLLRRRDLNLYHGLHPRVLENHQLSLLPARKASGMGEVVRTVGPYRAFPRDECPSRVNNEQSRCEEDCAFVRCTQSGKRSCMVGCREAAWDHKSDSDKVDGDDAGSTPLSPEFLFSDLPKADAAAVTTTPTSSSAEPNAVELTAQGLTGLHLGAKTKKKRDRKLSETDLVADACFDDADDDDDSVEVVEYPTDVFHPDLLTSSMSPKNCSNCSSRRSSIKDEDLLFGHLTKRKGKQMDDIFDDGSGGGLHGLLRPLNPPVTQVYRAETSFQQQQQQQQQQQHRQLYRDVLLQQQLQRPTSLLPPPLERSEVESPRLCPGSRLSSKRSSLDEDPEMPSPAPAVESAFDARLKFDEDRLNKVTTPKGAHPPEHDPDVGRAKPRVETVRCRSRSENIPTSSSSSSSNFLEPLDISFEEDKSFEDRSDDNWTPWKQNEHYLNSPDDENEEHFDFSGHHPLNNNSNVVPSTDAVNTFLKSFDSATSMVFHGRTGLPLTSSPAPLRRGKGKFDYDSAITTPHDIKRALFPSQLPERCQQLDVDHDHHRRRRHRRHSQKLLSASAPATIASTNLLCNFEESVLNGRLEPVSTVEGFTAEIGASGSFHPKHTVLPVTVFFYTLCDNATVSSPYLGHINLGKKGYRVPLKGTIQVTLFNPMGTVVKMFVVMYDLSDMPPNSQTFLRQRTLYMPSDKPEADNEEAQKWLRYLVHLRFASSKSGKLYLHTDIRMIIFRKSDLDTATEYNQGKGYELRSFTRGPMNPKFSPRR